MIKCKSWTFRVVSNSVPVRSVCMWLCPRMQGLWIKGEVSINRSPPTLFSSFYWGKGMGGGGRGVAGGG